MASSPKALVAALLVLGLATNCSLARPYYYYFQDAAKPVAAEPVAPAAPEAIQAIQASVPAQVQQAAGQVQQTIAGEQPADISHKIGGHLNELYTHGSSAVRQAVDTVQPDLKNIGHDLSEAYQQTRETVSKKIEPIAQTMRPYIDKAQKMIETQISSAREEIPKALTKVGEQVQGVWGKIKPHSGGVDDTFDEAAEQIQEVGKHAHHASNKVI